MIDDLLEDVSSELMRFSDQLRNEAIKAKVEIPEKRILELQRMSAEVNVLRRMAENNPMAVAILESAWKRDRRL